MKFRNFFIKNTTITIGKMVLEKMFPAHENQNFLMSSEFAEQFTSNDIMNQMRAPDNRMAFEANIIVPAMGLLYLEVLKTFADPALSSLFSMILIL